MNIRSLGYRTDLIFVAFDGVITDRGDYLVVRSPLNPRFYWGNFLLFSAPPQDGDFERWRQLFAREIGRPPRFEHQAFGWDSLEAEIGVSEPFLQAGFILERNVVLAAAEPRAPARPAANVEVRPLRSEADWAQALELQVLCREPGHEPAGYREFRRASMGCYRRMEAAGLGHWYGAFMGDRLVADLGVFHDGGGLGRYQAVETHPDFRRQGIAATLVQAAGQHAKAEYGLKMLVIIAEDESSPSRLYQAVGFEPREKNAGLLWWRETKTDEAAINLSPAP